MGFQHTTTPLTVEVRKATRTSGGPPGDNSVAQTLSIPKASLVHLQEQFHLAATAIVTGNRTKNWLSTIQRFLPFILLEASQRLPTLLSMKKQHGWKWSTTRTYHGAILAAMNILSIPLSLHEREGCKYLEKMLATEVVDFPAPLQPLDIDEIYGYATSETHAPTRITMTAICFAYLFGQRMGDVLQLHKDNIALNLPRTGLVVTIARGKVIQFCKPYTLHLPVDHNVGHLMLEWLSLPQGPLFPGTAAALVRETLHLLNPEYELRSIRRGGLQALAATGIDPETLRTQYSKHSSLQMLVRYLNHGALLKSQELLHHHLATVMEPSSSRVTSPQL